MEAEEPQTSVITVPQAAKSKIKVLEVPGTAASSQMLACCVLASQKGQRYSGVLVPPGGSPSRPCLLQRPHLLDLTLGFWVHIQP